MPQFDFNPETLARLTYLEADFSVDAPGDYVLCAVTGSKIPLDRLRYWSVDRQEAYKDAAASLEAHQAAHRSHP